LWQVRNVPTNGKPPPTRRGGRLLSAMVLQADRPKNAATTAVNEPTVTTAHIAATLRHPADGRLNHAVSVAAAVDLPPLDLPLPPYALGIWLGDCMSRSAQFNLCGPAGSPKKSKRKAVRVTRSQKVYLRYTIRFPEAPPIANRACAVCGLLFTPKTSQVRTCGRVCGGRSRSAEWRSRLGASSQPVCPDCGKPSSGFRQCQACRCDHGTVQAVLRSLGVPGEKHIPAIYLRSSRNQRRALLAGLLDSDGTVTSTGSAQFSVTSRRLAEDVRELVVSLGYRCGWSLSKCMAHPQNLPSPTRSHSPQPMTFPPRAEAGNSPRTQARENDPHAPDSASSPRCDRYKRACRFGACRLKAQTICTWPVAP